MALIWVNEVKIEIENQTKKTQVVFFTQPLNKSSYFAFLVEKDILRNTKTKHLTSFLYHMRIHYKFI